jgi:hypothetical protein
LLDGLQARPEQGAMLKTLAGAVRTLAEHSQESSRQLSESENVELSEESPESIRVTYSVAL